MFKHQHFFVLSLILTLAESAGAVTSAELYRSTAQAFGRFEARIRFAAGDGVVSSFFLWKEGSERSDVFWNELDFEKIGAACELQTNSIYGLPQSNHEGSGYVLEGLCEGYHTYTYEWTPEYIAWFVDGIEIRRDTGADATAYAENAADGMQFRFNIWPGNSSFGGNFSEAILPVYQFVAWAQYSQYTPGAGENGSNFTLAWREEFDAKPREWQMGSWESPLGRSTHSAKNVAFVNGIAVIALTADGATGYSGTPPPDVPSESGVPSTGGAVPSATDGAVPSATDGAVPAATGGAGTVSPGPTVEPPTERGDEGGSCRVNPAPSRVSGAVALLAGAILGWLVRRRRRTVAVQLTPRDAGNATSF